MPPKFTTAAETQTASARFSEPGWTRLADVWRSPSAIYDIDRLYGYGLVWSMTSIAGAGFIWARDRGGGWWCTPLSRDGDVAPQIFHTETLQNAFLQNAELRSPLRATLTLNSLPLRSFTYTHKASPSPHPLSDGQWRIRTETTP